MLIVFLHTVYVYVHDVLQAHSLCVGSAIVQFNLGRSILPRFRIHCLFQPTILLLHHFFQWTTYQWFHHFRFQIQRFRIKHSPNYLALCQIILDIQHELHPIRECCLYIITEIAAAAAAAAAFISFAIDRLSISTQQMCPIIRR